MNDIINLAIVLGCLALPFVAMPLLWRRMKRIRNQTYQQQKQDRRAQPWEESLGTDGKVRLARSGSANEDLIDLGSKARETRWPIDNS
ncbi:hypothetical protein SAMN05518849_12735 [Sphingobium sp. AP50]|uniref:hypothetical protein n=1 Tax=Sphingobium sp. AP50 TaxID=1884369 RepID=UPI0008BD6DAA|nr:hypothetical protein [Sphingobium sp. AP50]SEK01771.1 hypothetical protein SAMN05518849_12735 [Sphingobium sp. AP50]